MDRVFQWILNLPRLAQKKTRKSFRDPIASFGLQRLSNTFDWNGSLVLKMILGCCHLPIILGHLIFGQAEEGQNEEEEGEAHITNGEIIVGTSTSRCVIPEVDKVYTWNLTFQDEDGETAGTSTKKKKKKKKVRLVLCNFSIYIVYLHDQGVMLYFQYCLHTDIDVSKRCPSHSWELQGHLLIMVMYSFDTLCLRNSRVPNVKS